MRGSYDIARFGNVSVLHFTDCHAQLLPTYFREPSVNLGLGEAMGRPPHLVGESLLKHFGIPAGSREAHAFTYLDFAAAAKTYGTLGGFAHLATLVKKLKASRPGALLLDGGDTWQGSATALWTRGQDMVDAAKLLWRRRDDRGTGSSRSVRRASRRSSTAISPARSTSSPRTSRPRISAIRCFQSHVLRSINGVSVAIIGQAFPLYADRQPALFRSRLDVRHPG
jgi:sulfur-oxidizing protein SoxB